MTRDRDVHAFHARAPGYESGYRGQLHREIVDLTIDLALARFGPPERVLDVGCGTGLLLRELGKRVPAASLTGIDAAPGMIERAQALALNGNGQVGNGQVGNGRGGNGQAPAFVPGTAERLPFGDGEFDLVISTTSFDHWADQGAGLAQCYRVLAPGGHLVLTDQFSSWLLPTLVGSRSEKARTPLRATKLLAAAGFRSLTWHRLYAVIIRTVTAAA